MKKLVSLILIVFILMLSAGCDTKSDSASGGSVSSNVPASSDVSNADGFVKPSGFSSASFSCGQSGNILELTLSSDWEFNKVDRTFEISRQGKEIGTVSGVGGALPSNYTELKNVQLNDLRIRSAAYYSQNGEYRRKITYFYPEPSGNTRLIEFDVLYTEVSGSLLSRMTNFAKFRRVRTNANFGMLDQGGKKTKVLIIGNSFVSSSNIKSVVNNVCGGSITADAISIGYGEVHTFASNVGCMSAISSGNYDIVLLCGLYSEGKNITAIETILDACDQVGADLVLFPAHNESRSAINTALREYPDVYILDWKAEIEALIEAGADYDAFCIDDYHKHSTPLAGYVGANMLYRAVVGELPTQAMNGQALNKAQMAMLDDYLKTGTVSLYTPTGSVYYL